jgi:two-component system, response regulator PdtaR
MGQAAKPVVLLVEDEPLTRMDACMGLQDAGFEVLDAADAETALNLVRERPDIAVLFTDVQMPGLMDGVTLARVVHAIRPDIRLLVTSGGLKLRDSDLPDEAKFVPKPYVVEGLAREIKNRH